MQPDRQDLDAQYWTLAQAARHFGFTRATISKYVREGLPTYLGGGWVKPAEVVAEKIARSRRHRDTLVSNNTDG